MKKPRRKTRAHYTFFDSSRSSLLSSHVLITLFGSPSPNLVVLLNVTKLWVVGLVNLSYKRKRKGCNETRTRQVLKSDQVSNLVGGTVKQVPCKQAAYPTRLGNQIDYVRLGLWKVFASAIVCLLVIMF